MCVVVFWRLGYHSLLDPDEAHYAQITGDAEELRRFLEPSPYAHVLMLDRDYVAMRQEGLDLEPVVERPAIVGRTGKYFRRQIWGKLIVARRRATSG